MRNIEEIKLDYRNGISLTKLAKIEGVSRQTLSRKLKKSGEIVTNKHNCLKFNEHYFDDINSEEKAYWLGFIFADGCIYTKTKSFELGLAIKDHEHIDKFVTAIQFTGKLYKSKTSIRCCLRSEHFWTVLNSLGCVPNKSLILRFPTIPNKYQIPFIRGYFDGDGCISQHMYSKTTSPNISILGTKPFLDKIIEITKVPAKFRHDSRHSDDVYSIEYSKDDGVKFINLIYNDATIALNRKFSKFLFFKNGSRSTQEWVELQSGNIGEIPEEENPEISSEIKKSEPSYSVECETCNFHTQLGCISSSYYCIKNKNIIIPRVSDTPTEISG